MIEGVIFVLVGLYFIWATSVIIVTRKRLNRYVEDIYNSINKDRVSFNKEIKLLKDEIRDLQK